MNTVHTAVQFVAPALRRLIPLIWLAAVLPASAQDPVHDEPAEWIYAGGGPSSRWGHKMIFDEVRGAFVMFGGTYYPYRPGTYEWDGVPLHDFTLREPAGPDNPSERMFPSLTYDSFEQVGILVGGAGAPHDEGITWQIDDDGWTQVHDFSSSGTGPFRLMRHETVFDKSTGKMILFGGRGHYGDGNHRLLGDTWEWDTSEREWTLVHQYSDTHLRTGPVPREYHAMAYDAHRQKVVLFGGQGLVGGRMDVLADTWEWDSHSRTWTEMQPELNGLTFRVGAVMVFQPNIRPNGEIMMFGGYVGSPNPLETNEVWAYDGTRWILIDATGDFVQYRSSPSIAYDPRTTLIAIYGGFSSYVGDISGVFLLDWGYVTH